MLRMTHPLTKRGRRPAPPDHAESPLIWTAERIGKYINRTTQMVYAMHRAGKLPVRSVGAILVARKADLDNPSTWPQKKCNFCDRQLNLCRVAVN
jgi:hypothetical protein